MGQKHCCHTIRNTAAWMFAELNLTSTYNWITNFNNTELYDSAVAKGYIPTSQDSMRDPFYVTTAPTYKTDMWVKMYSNYRNGFGLYHLAIGSLFCKDLQWPIDKDNCYRQILTTHPVSSLTPDQKNQAWITFRNLYAAARDSTVNAYIVKSVPLPNNDTLVNRGYRVHFTNSDKQLASNMAMSGRGSRPPPTMSPTLPAYRVELRLQPCIPAVATVGILCRSCGKPPGRLTRCPAWLPAQISDAILNQITTGMAEVCYEGKQ